MNDEIKEILDALEVQPEEFTTDYSLLLTIKQQKVLLDYINNLQQNYDNNINKYEELIEKYSNLQQRIDKAIEYINTHYLNANEPELLDILKGDSDE